MNTRVLASLVVATVSLNVLVSNSQEPEYRQPTREEKLTTAKSLCITMMMLPGPTW